MLFSMPFSMPRRGNMLSFTYRMEMRGGCGVVARVVNDMGS
jgi:hypothetical protein